VLVVPGHEERLAVAFEAERPPAFARDDAEALCGVDLVDAVERRQFEARLARIGVKLERSRANHRVVADELRRFEISLDALVLYELHVAEVGESFAAH
jgi:hypothetical protein